MAFLDGIKDYYLGNSKTGEIGALDDRANNPLMNTARFLGFGGNQFANTFTPNTPIVKNPNPVNPIVNNTIATPVQPQVSANPIMPQMPGLPQARDPMSFITQPQAFNGGGMASNFQNPFGSANYNQQPQGLFRGNFTGTAGNVQQALNGINPYQPITNQYALDQRQIRDNDYNRINQDYRGQHLDNFLNADNLQDFFRGAIIGHQDRSDMARATDLLKQNNTISQQNIDNINTTTASDVASQRTAALGLGTIQNTGNQVGNEINKTNADIQNQGFNQGMASYDKQVQAYQNTPLWQAQRQYQDYANNPRNYTVDEIKAGINADQDKLYQQQFGKDYLSNAQVVNQLRSQLQQRDLSNLGRNVAVMQNPNALFQMSNPGVKIEANSLTGGTTFSGDLNPQTLPQLIKLKQQFDAATQAQANVGNGIPVLGNGTTIVNK